MVDDDAYFAMVWLIEESCWEFEERTEVLGGVHISRADSTTTWSLLEK
jgi:hypothetical protein